MKKRIFFITFIIANLALVAYGVLAISMPGILYETFSLHVYQFPPEAGAAVPYLKALFSLEGYFNILIGVLCLYLLFHHRESQKLGWVIIAPILAYLGPVTFDNMVGSIGFFEIFKTIFQPLIKFPGGKW